MNPPKLGSAVEASIHFGSMHHCSMYICTENLKKRIRGVKSFLVSEARINVGYHRRSYDIY